MKPTAEALKAAIAAEVEAYVHSKPPPAELTTAYAKVMADTDTPTGVHRVEDLRLAERSRTVAALAPRLASAEAFRETALRWFRWIQLGLIGVGAGATSLALNAAVPASWQRGATMVGAVTAATLAAVAVVSRAVAPYQPPPSAPPPAVDTKETKP